MGDVLEETGFTDIGVSTDEKSSCVWVDGGKTAQMASDLLEVDERIFHALADRGHATEGGSLQLFALVQRLSILEQSDIIAGYQIVSIPFEDLECTQRTNSLNQCLRSRQLPKRNLEVIRVVQCVHEIAVERMDIGELWEAIEDRSELFGEGLGCVFDFSGVELVSQSTYTP